MKEYQEVERRLEELRRSRWHITSGWIYDAGGLGVADSRVEAAASGAVIGEIREGADVLAARLACLRQKTV